MSKNQTLSYKAIALIICSIIVFGLGILFLINELQNFLNTDIDLGSILTGVVIILVGSFILLPIIRKKHNKNSWIFITEYALILLAGIVGFIIPGIDPSLVQKLGTPSLWVGLIISFHALSYLISNQYSKKLITWVYLTMLLLLFLGGMIIGGNLIDPYIKWFIVFAFFLAALFLLIKALALPKVEKKSKKK